MDEVQKAEAALERAAGELDKVLEYAENGDVFVAYPRSLPSLDELVLNLRAIEFADSPRGDWPSFDDVTAVGLVDRGDWYSWAEVGRRALERIRELEADRIGTFGEAGDGSNVVHVPGDADGIALRNRDEMAECRYCGRTIFLEDGTWVDPEATGDDSIWRETCEAHDTFEAEHEPEDVPRVTEAEKLEAAMVLAVAEDARMIQAEDAALERHREAIVDPGTYDSDDLDAIVVERDREANRAETRVRFEYDDEPDLSYLEQWDTPEKYAGNEVIGEGGKPVPFERYIETWGNLDHHETLVALAERKCECCGEWSVTDSLGGLDFYTGPGAQFPRDFPVTGTFSSPDELPEGSYQREMFTDLAFEIPRVY